MQNRQIKTASDLGVIIREARKDAGLTQRDFALALGTGERFIGELENGKETVRLGLALKAATSLGVKITAS